MTEKQIERVKKKIKHYRAFLAAEKRRFGGYFDNRGIRYIIPELFLQIQDYKGAQVYFRWFSKAFSDDVGFPEFNLFWAATLFENNKVPEALRKVYETAFSNTYLLDLISGKDPTKIDKSELSGAERLYYAKEIYKDCIGLITFDFQTWITSIVDSEEFRANLNRFISLQKLIEDEPVGKMRNHLISESNKFEARLTGRHSN